MNNSLWTDDDLEVPADVLMLADTYSSKLLPDKSKDKYIACYNNFIDWMNKRNFKSFKEPILLAYLGELSNKLSSATLWSIYSMIKSVLKIRENVDISEYHKVTAFLKKLSVGYVPRKSKILENTDVEKFLREAPDEVYLGTKVILIVGVMGACRREELWNIVVDDVKDRGDLLIITIPKTKTYVQRNFVIDSDMYPIVKKYMNLRPPYTDSQRFFLRYENGKCVNQVIGLNTFGKMPQRIAEYLRKDNPEDYTGHAFRRTGATLLADAGGSLLEVKRLGAWKSDNVAQGYIEDSLYGKMKISRKIAQSINFSATSFKKYKPSETITSSEDKTPQSLLNQKLFSEKPTKSSSYPNYSSETSNDKENINTSNDLKINAPHRSVTINNNYGHISIFMGEAKQPDNDN